MQYLAGAEYLRALFSLSFLFFSMSLLYLSLRAPKENKKAWHAFSLFALFYSLHLGTDIYLREQAGGLSLLLSTLFLAVSSTSITLGAAQIHNFTAKTGIRKGFSAVVAGIVLACSFFLPFRAVLFFLLLASMAWTSSGIARMSRTTREKFRIYYWAISGIMAISIALILVSLILEGVPSLNINRANNTAGYIIMCVQTLLLFSLSYMALSLAYSYSVMKFASLNTYWSVVLAGSFMLVLVIAMYGAFYINMAEADYLGQLRQELAAKSQFLEYEIDNTHEQNMNLARALSGMRPVRHFLSNRTDECMGRAHEMIDTYKEEFGLSVVYVMDGRGITVLSSNRYRQDSFMGKNYSFRPYFAQAMGGNAGLYLARGVTSGVRGAYYSYPVRQGSEILGAVIIKTNVDKFKEKLKFFDNAHLISPNGLIFISSNPDWLYHTLSPISQAQASEITSGRQFGIDEVRSLGFRQEDGFMLRNSSTLLFTQAATRPDEWSIVLFESMSGHSAVRLGSIARIVFVLLLIFLVMLFGFHYHIDSKVIAVSEENYRNLFNHTNDMIVLFAKNGRVLYSNPSAKNTLGKIKSFWAVLKKHDAENIRSALHRQDRTEIEMWIKAARERIKVQGTVHSGSGSGGNVRYTAVMQDITRQSKAMSQAKKRASELEKINRLTIDRELKMIELKKKIRELG